jgi:hypothetical protein
MKRLSALLAALAAASALIGLAAGVASASTNTVPSKASVDVSKGSVDVTSTPSKDAASTASKMLWRSPYDAAAQAISGYPDTHADFEDNWTEWQSFLSDPSCPTCVTGFTYPFVAPTDPLYHQIFLSPEVSTAMLGGIPLPSTFSPIWARLGNGTQDPMEAAISILTFIHENYHLRFVSGDEGLVNACALRDFPYWLSNQFEIPATNTVTVPQTVTRTKRVVRYRWTRIHHHRRHVRYHKTIRYTVTVNVARTQPNQLYQTLVNDAHTVYASQPAPYNTGTCTEPAIG